MQKSAATRFSPLPPLRSGILPDGRTHVYIVRAPFRLRLALPYYMAVDVFLPIFPFSGGTVGLSNFSGVMCLERELWHCDR